MNKETIREFLLRNEDYLYLGEEESLVDALSVLPDDFEAVLNDFPFRNPKTFSLITIFLGALGVDRFYLGDIKKGVLKYITFGGVGIWWIMDIRSANERIRKYNTKKLMEAASDPSLVGSMKERDAKMKAGFRGGVKIVKELIKGGKEIQNSFFVDD